MRSIHVINKLFLEHGILCAKGENNRIQPVHLRQGDMDGACAIYSLMMGMITSGIINRKDAEGLYQNLDGRSSLAKLLKQLTLEGKKEGLVREGLYLSSVHEVASHTFTSKMRTSYSDVINNIEYIRQNLDGDNPVIIGGSYRGKGGHALLAVGYEAENEIVTKLFCLDPGYQLPECCYWNSVIYINANSVKEYKHTYMPNGNDIKIDECICIFKK